MTAAVATRPDVTAPPSTPVGVEARAVAATLACVARHGLAKTTIDDIARQAGCSRATLYRYFESKSDLVGATIRSEAARIIGLIHDAARDMAILEDAVVAILECADRELSGHPALTFVADFEPERLLPHLTFGGGDRFLQRAGAALAPSISAFVPDDPQRAGEWIARVGLALWMSPASRGALSAPEALRAYVHDFIVPAIMPMQSDLVLPSPSNPSRG
ncbi:MAG TPA: TetR/AcrR family transcriptional regulator [Acidimicrobiia bacterium]|nr:TetR/AcrR family transcriptional regulator [Acidimicrobiia bacterium]